MKTYHLTTFGCQMNKSDSERIITVLEQQLKLKSTPQESADLLIFNLCSVRQSAVDRVWGAIAKNKKQITNNKKTFTIITGCILEADKKKLASKVGLILDIKDLANWPMIIQSVINKKKRATNDSRQTTYNKRLMTNEKLLMKNDYFSITPQYSSFFSAYVPIMTGCNNFCSYCVVPYTRNREVSRPVEEIMTEVKSLIRKGYKEIILLGQNVNSFNGQQKTTNKKQKTIKFPELLKMIDALPGDYWLSFVTSHPKDMSSDLIACFKECAHLMPYIHLPVQSGSNKILKAMNRNYTAQHYQRLVSKIRKTNTGICISTDIIVGFPGETKTDFENTARFMKKIKFDMAYLAQYSARAGTAAAKFKDDVQQNEKKHREKILNEILKKTALANNKKMTGQTITVLVESIKNGYALGHTWHMKHVKILTTDLPRRQAGNRRQII